MVPSTLRAALVGFSFIEEALGWSGDRWSEHIEQRAQLADLEAQGQLSLLDPLSSIGNGEGVETFSRVHTAECAPADLASVNPKKCNS